MVDPTLLIKPFLITLVAGLSTVLGGLIFIFGKKISKNQLLFSLSLSAGAMIYISFAELLHMAINEVGFLTANIWFLAGLFFMMALDTLIPHHYLSERSGVQSKHLSMHKTGIMVFIGIAIHNFPEGMAVFLSGFAETDLAVSIALAITIHNIPEGIAIASPILYATNNKKKALLYTLFAGLMEPIGGLIGFIILAPYLNESVIACVFAFIAGIMVLISFDELLPQVFATNESHTLPIWGILLGMFIMIATLTVI